MVASTPEYHILGKRVAVERLQLGTIINSVKDLTRLNAGKESKIAEKRLFCFHDINFEATRDDALKGEAGVAVKALAIDGVGADAKIDGERGNVDKYKFSSLDTLEFDAEREDYLEAVKATGVQKFLETSGYSPVYFITGIQTGKGRSIDFTKVKKIGGDLKFGVNLGTAVSVGPNTSASKKITTTQKSDGLTDVIFAIRVRKLVYKREYLGLFGARKLVDEASDVGAEMAGDDNLAKDKKESESVFGVEEVEEEEEFQGYKKISELDKNGRTITWVVPEDF